MSVLTSKNFKLEYEFCQSKTFPDLNKQVIAAGGVCTVCATDWLLAKMDDKAFVFSQQTIQEKSRQIEAIMKGSRDLEGLFKEPLASKLELNTNAKVSFTTDKDKGDVVANLLKTHGHLIVRLDGNKGSHALALFKKAGGKYYMFDPNFGSYEASEKKGVAEWWKELVTYNRPGKGCYENILIRTQLFPFDTKQ